MPLNAGLPLILDVMDEAEARLGFDGAWDSWLEEALHDEQFVLALERASRLGLGSPMEQLKSVAWELNSNHDLISGNSFVSGPDPDPIDFDYMRRTGRIVGAAPRVLRSYRRQAIRPHQRNDAAANREPGRDVGQSRQGGGVPGE